MSFSGPGSAPNGTAPSYRGRIPDAAVGQSSLSFNAWARQAVRDHPLQVRDHVLDGSRVGQDGNVGLHRGHRLGARSLRRDGSRERIGCDSFATATVTAQDLYNNPASTWTSATKCVSFSGPGNAPNGTAPSYPAQVGCAAGQSSLSFNASGQASGFAITLYKSETTSLTATASAKTGTSGSIVVSPGTTTAFLVTAPSSTDGGLDLRSDVANHT